jgi:hypothetical protein
MLWQLAHEAETNTKLKKYRTDNGELKTEKLNEWLRSRGTDHELTAPHTSAHIGRVEHMHRTLMEKGHTMRIYAKLPPFLWDEFYLTAAHLHVKTTTRTLKGRTPFELWFNQKPDYSYMSEIGCRAFVLIQNKNNPKIYGRSLECTLVRYDAKSKTYHCYHHETNSIFSSYHVEFLESHHGHELLELAPKTNATSNAASNDNYQPPKPLPAILDDPDLPPPPPLPTPNIPPIAEWTRSQTTAQPVDNQSQTDLRCSRHLQTDDSSHTRGETRLEQTIREVRQSANRVSQARQDNQPPFWDIIPPAATPDSQPDNLANLVELYESDTTSLCFLSTDSDAHLPTTWQEATFSPDADKWLAAYHDELKSRKDMDVYELVPCSDVPAGQ